VVVDISNLERGVSLTPRWTRPTFCGSFIEADLDDPPSIHGDTAAGPVAIHRDVPVVHRPATHGHEAPSTPSTP